MESILSWIIPVSTTVTSGLLLFWIQRFLMQQHKNEERRDLAKEKDTILILRSLDALGKLTVANSIALRDKKTNGEMSSALAAYETVEKELYDHLVSYHSHILH